MGKDLLPYSNKIESSDLRKCPHDHYLINKAYISGVTVRTFMRVFPQNGGENQLAYIWNEITPLSRCVYCALITSLELGQRLSKN